MNVPPRVLLSESTNPWFNLATEDWIFREFSRDTPVLFLCRNVPSVVIGRHQNPWVECDLAAMRRDGVLLARRQSGGGAVYHDRGNANFTFVSPTAAYSQEENFRIVIAALQRLGIQAERSGRHDILVTTPLGKRKISGNAFKHTRERCFHHGTLLIDADLDRLARYLTPESERLNARGTRSVASPVINLREIVPSGMLTYQMICDALAAEFLDAYGVTGENRDRDVLNEESLAEIPSLNDYYGKISAWEWLFGATPRFSHTVALPGRGFQSDFLVNHGRIEEVVLHCENPSTPLSVYLNDTLRGLPYGDAAILRIIEGGIAHFHSRDDARIFMDRVDAEIVRLERNAI